jgi:hypothetical protein
MCVSSYGLIGITRDRHNRHDRRDTELTIVAVIETTATGL